MPTFGIKPAGKFSENEEWLRKIIPNLEDKLARVDAVNQPRKCAAIARRLKRFRDKLERLSPEQTVSKQPTRETQIQ
jgi:hypothetical protein